MISPKNQDDRRSARLKGKMMKKNTFRTATLMLALCLLTCSLSSCRLHKMAYDKDENLYTDARTDVSYTDAPGCYEPVSIGKEYAKWSYNRKSGVTFFEIGGMDPTKWLCEEGKTVFYAEGETLPTLTEMAPDTVYLCVEEVSTLVLSTITDAEDIAALVDVYLNGTEVTYTGLEPTLNLRVKFASPTYPGLYYSLIYLEYSDGSKVLYDRYSARCVDVGDVLIDYVGGDEEV